MPAETALVGHAVDRNAAPLEVGHSRRSKFGCLAPDLFSEVQRPSVIIDDACHGRYTPANTLPLEGTNGLTI